MSNSDIRDILINFSRSGILSEVCFLPTELLNKLRLVDGVSGIVDIEGQCVNINIGVDKHFPFSIPHIWIRPWNALGFIPHVMSDAMDYGVICYLEKEGAMLISENPLGIIVQAFDLALSVLRAGAKGENVIDFMDEFRVYWQDASRLNLLSFIKLDQNLREVYSYSNEKNCWIVTDNQSVAIDFFNGDSSIFNSLTRRAALYVPLQSKSIIIPPTPSDPWNLEKVRTYIRANLSAGNFRELKRRCKKAKRQELVILGIPRPSGGVIPAGILFHCSSEIHPLLGGTAEEFPECVSIQRMDKDYLVARGGGRLDLCNSRILIAGCGSVGGFVAFQLAQAGISQLLLLDPDSMTLENAYRHILGRSKISKPKVEALKEELESKFPYMGIQTLKMDIQDAIQDNKIDLRKFDLIVLAIGNPTVELEINRKVHRLTDGPLVVFTWLEPYGIGGHALLTRPGLSGCFHCLYETTEDPNFTYANRASFSMPGQRFSKDDLGCGNQFTPYGALHAQRTAALATQLILDGLMGRETRNTLLSWKGSDAEFRSKGFKVSPRYNYNSYELDEQRYDFILKNCPACRGYHN